VTLLSADASLLREILRCKKPIANCSPALAKARLGEVSASDLASAIAGTSANSNAVATLDDPFANDPPTLADMETLRSKVNELINALRR
jgi:hypothetical protein